MKLSAFQSLKIGFGTAIILLLASLILNYTLSFKLKDNVLQTEKLYKVVHQMDKVLYMQFLCESDVRGYLVTRDNHFIDEYKQHQKLFLTELNILNGTPYSDKMIEYNDLVKYRIQVMDEKLNLASSDFPNDKEIKNLVNKGQILSDSIIKLKDSIETYEMKLLAERAADIKSEFINMKYISLFCALAAIAMGIITIGIMKKYVHEKQKRLEEMQELDNNKNKFFSIISHDLRAPVNRLAQLSKMIGDSYQMNNKEDLTDMIKLSRSSILRIKTLLDNLLTWGKIQMQKIEFNPEEVHVFSLVENIIDHLKDISQSKKIDIQNNVSKEASIYGDVNMLEMIMRNLVHNAIKYSNPNSKVIITTIVMNGQVEILVRDYGVGMEKEFIDRLFKLDTVYSKSGTASEEGSGMALIICKEFIKKNRGILSINSHPGKGTVISTTFPSYNFRTLLQYDQMSFSDSKNAV